MYIKYTGKNIKLSVKLLFLICQTLGFYTPPPSPHKKNCPTLEIIPVTKKTFYSAQNRVRFKLNFSVINNDALFWLLYLIYCMCYNCQMMDHLSGSFLLFVFANNLEEGTCSKLLHSHKPIITLECLHYLPVKSVTRNFIITTTVLDPFILIIYL